MTSAHETRPATAAAPSTLALPVARGIKCSARPGLALAVSLLALAASVLVLAAPLFAVPAAGGETPPAEPERPRTQDPLDIGKRESVEVRLVTVDVLVLDKQDRTVPGLLASDFELEVDGKTIDVDTLDVTCPAGAASPPKSGRIGKWTEPPAVSDASRRIVFTLDYLHLATLPCPDMDASTPCLYHTQVLKALQRLLRGLPQGDEEIMVVALDGALRVEQPFTRDRAQVLDTLARMEKDITLWAGRYEHVSEKPLFGGLEALLDLLDMVPGSKALVLFSAGPGPGSSYDVDFKRIRNLASLSRVSFYPIDCQGLYAKRFT